MTVAEFICSSLILMFIGGIGKTLYDYRQSIWIFIKKQRLKLFPVSFNVALSIEFEEGLNSGTYYQEITSNLKKAIEEQNLLDVLKLKDFSDIYKFDNREEAGNYREKKKLDLIIWGKFSKDNLKLDSKNVNVIDLNFTFGHPRDPDNKIGHMIIMDIKSNLATKSYWKIVEDNSFEDVKIISNNLFDISIYIVAVSLKMFGRIGTTIKLLESLYENLTVRQDPFKERLVPHLINCYELIVLDAVFDKNIYSIGKECCEKILKIKGNDLFGLSNLAVFQYHMGQKKEAKATVDKLLKSHPRAPVTEVDVAFFKILEKDYKGAFKHYQRLLNCTPEQLNFNIIYTIEFLNGIYDATKEPALLYARGFLSYFYADKKIGRHDLKDFLKKGNDHTYKEMYRSAKRILKIKMNNDA